MADPAVPSREAVEKAVDPSRPAGGVEGSEVARLRAENAIMRAALEGQDVHAGGVEDRELVERVMDAIQGVGLSRANRRKVANAAVAVLREAGSAGDSEVERLRAENGIMRAALEGQDVSLLGDDDIAPLEWRYLHGLVDTYGKRPLSATLLPKLARRLAGEVA